jgi:hypothetical protein
LRIVGLLILMLACGFFATPGLVYNEEKLFPVPPPPFTEDIYPCSDCHDDMETDLERRELEDEHVDIELQHAEHLRWCLDCHDADDRDKLHLQNGEKIGFDESYRLCGQCHGTDFRDWRAGVHGRRTGYWNGPKEYLLCAHCHNPHRPKYQPLKPMPPPDHPTGQGPVQKDVKGH